MVSTTAWQSFPAVKPGPTPTTTGASVMRVPRFRLAKIASTSASGCSSCRQASSGSASTGTAPCDRYFFTAAVSGAYTARTPSTVVSPSVMAGEKQTVRRMAVGRGRSVMTTCRPLRYSRRAMPVAMSPAPRIRTSIVSPLYHRLTRANTPDSVSFRRFLPFSPCWASAQRRLKNQKSLENTSLAGAEQFCRSRNVSRQEKTRREYLPYCQGA